MQRQKISSSTDHLQEVREISLKESKSIERAAYQMQNHESEIGFKNIRIDVQEPETIKNHNQRQVSNAGFGTSDKVEESHRVNRGIAETPSGA